MGERRLTSQTVPLAINHAPSRRSGRSLGGPAITQTGDGVVASDQTARRRGSGRWLVQQHVATAAVASVQ